MPATSLEIPFPGRGSAARVEGERGTLPGKTTTYWEGVSCQQKKTVKDTRQIAQTYAEFTWANTFHAGWSTSTMPNFKTKLSQTGKVPHFQQTHLRRLFHQERLKESFNQHWICASHALNARQKQTAQTRPRGHWETMQLRNRLHCTFIRHLYR